MHVILNLNVDNYGILFYTVYALFKTTFILCVSVFICDSFYYILLNNFTSKTFPRKVRKGPRKGVLFFLAQRAVQRSAQRSGARVPRKG